MKLVVLFSYLMLLHCAIGKNETTTRSVEYCLANVVEDCRENCFVWCEGQRVALYPDAVPWYCHCNGNNQTSNVEGAAGDSTTASSSNASSCSLCNETGLLILEILLNFFFISL